MTDETLELGLRILSRRRPFRAFQVDFNNGAPLVVSPPEALNRYDGLFVFRGPDHCIAVFTGGDVCLLSEPPTALE